MEHRRVGEVMTRQVVAARPGTGFRELVALLAEHDITAVPVVDAAGRPLGVVSEADLLRTQLAQEDPSGMLPPSAQPRGPGSTAGALMTAPAVCTVPGASVVAAARLMARHRIVRLPVVDEAGRLVGTVDRGDLLRVYLRGDRAIHREIVEEVLGVVEGVSPAGVGVEVEQGRVVLSGTVPAELAPVLRRLCAAVDGVVEVTDRTVRPDGGRACP